MFNHDQIVYLAGIIDGEGSILIEKQSPCKSRKTTYYSIRLIVVNTNSSLMDWLFKTFKGNVLKRKKIEGQRTCFTWSIFSYNAAAILKECLPYMIVKKRHAEIVLEFMSLDKKGWNVPENIQIRRQELYLDLKKEQKPN